MWILSELHRIRQQLRIGPSRISGKHRATPARRSGLVFSEARLGVPITSLASRDDCASAVVSPENIGYSMRAEKFRNLLDARDDVEVAESTIQAVEVGLGIRGNKYRNTLIDRSRIWR